MSRDDSPLRDRIIAALRWAGHPCTRGELMHMGCFRPGRGERAVDVQTALDAMEVEGVICQAMAAQPIRGTHPGIAWRLVTEIANWKPVRLAGHRRAPHS